MDISQIMILVFILFVANAIICGYIGSRIDGDTGIVWGVFLGPFGLIIAAILKVSDKLDVIIQMQQEVEAPKNGENPKGNQESADEELIEQEVNPYKELKMNRVY